MPFSFMSLLAVTVFLATILAFSLVLTP
jgi:hypothetical protein